MARQLAHPSGWFGRLFTAHWLDEDNAAMNAMTLERLALNSGDRLLEIGFGGGSRLEMALASQPCEYVAGVDLSADMVSHVTRRLRPYIRAGKAEVRRGDIEARPLRIFL